MWLSASLYAQSGYPISLQAESRVENLMAESLPEATLPSETADRLQIHHEPTYQSTTPLYRKLTVGNPAEVFALVIDRSTSPVMWIDLNRNGDLADDFPLPSTKSGAEYYWDVSIPAHVEGQLKVLPYRVALLPDGSVVAIARYGARGYVTLENRRYLCIVQPASVDGQGTIWGLDLNGDGRVDGNPLSGERFEASEPVNINGHTFALALSKTDTQLVPSDAEADPKPHIAVGERAPDVPLRTISGQADHLLIPSHWTLVSFWASWCRPCWDEFPALISLRSKFGTQLRIIGVNLDEMGREGKSEEDLPAFLRDHQISWPTIYDHPTRTTSIARRFNVQDLPVNVLIDPSGVIRWIGRRDVSEAASRFVPKPQD